MRLGYVKRQRREGFLRMFLHRSASPSPQKLRPRRAEQHPAPLGDRLVFSCCLLGVLGGAVVGLYSPGGALSLGALRLGAFQAVPDGFPGYVLAVAVWFLLLALGGTSYLGFLAALLVSFFSAFRLSCSVAARFVSAAYPGLWEALLRYGVPALLAAPFLLAAAGGCFRAAQRLYQLRFHPAAAPKAGRVLPLSLGSSAAVLLAAAYCAYLLPLLLP